MTCATCQNTIESHLQSVKGLVEAKVSLLTHKACIKYQSREIGIRNIIQEIEALGFGARYEPQSDKADIRTIINESVVHYRKKFLLSLAIQIPIMILIWIIPYTSPHFVTYYNRLNGVPLYVYLVALLSTIIQLFLGASFYISSYKSLKHKSANMDVLIALGTTAAWGYGLALIFVGYDHEDLMHTHEYQMQVQEHTHNFEISSVLITIILLGKFLETISKKKTVDKLSKLASLKVTKAFIIDKKPSQRLSLNLQEKEIEVELLLVNDLVKVYPGGGIPIDGQIVYGKGIVNEAMLTGEARPIAKEIGSLVFGGSILIQGNLIIQVKKTAENSSLNQIIKLVENAQNARAPIQSLADNVAKYFVPFIILISVITWIAWFSYAYSDRGKARIDLKGETRFQFAFDFGIATLVIACPCALGLATPTAVMVGTGVAATYGILIKGGDILEKINKITTIVFDKTGTLTSGQPQVKDLISVKEHFKYEGALDNKDLLFYFTYLAEKGSEHPLAKAIVKKIESIIPSKIEEYENVYKMSEFKNREGEGVVATIINTYDNTTYQVLCGNDKLLKFFNINITDQEVKKNVELLEEEGNTVIQVIVNQIPQLIISLEEQHIAKFESKEVVKYLQNQMKVRVAMITGDNQHAAYKVARHLGIDLNDVVYKAYPEDKKKTVERFQEQGESVMFIGDGINDSPVLAQANVGVAINSASDITVNAADIVLMKDNLYDVINAILISKKAFRRIKINFVWAFLYNLLLVPVAAGVFYPINGFKFDPMLAGAAMALSSISVVISSLMLKFFTPIQKKLSKKVIHQEDFNKKRSVSIEYSPATTAISDRSSHL